MRGFSYSESVGTMVFASPGGAKFPVSTKAVASNTLKAVGSDVLDDLMFTMRSEPTEQNHDVLEDVMFTMRSEPTEHHCPSADPVS